MQSVDLVPRPLTMPLEQALAERRSTRTGGALSFGNLSTVLWHTSRRPPSAGGLRTVHAVVAASGVEGVPDGVWRLVESGRTLLRGDGQEAARTVLGAAGGAMQQGTTPPAVVLLRADWTAIRKKYGRAAIPLAVREAGVWIGVLGLVCAAAGVGGCALGPATWGRHDLGAFALSDQ